MLDSRSWPDLPKVGLNSLNSSTVHLSFVLALRQLKPEKLCKLVYRFSADRSLAGDKSGKRRLRYARQLGDAVARQRRINDRLPQLLRNWFVFCHGLDSIGGSCQVSSYLFVKYYRGALPK